jgi:hypothetical protein
MPIRVQPSSMLDPKSIRRLRTAVPRSAFAVLAFALAACAPASVPARGPPPGSAGLSLRTDRAAYEARYVEGEGNHQRFGFRLIARFENRTGAAVFLDRCEPNSPRPIYSVEPTDPARRVGLGGYSPVWACAAHDRPIVVQPGAVRVDTLRIVGPNAWDGRTGERLGPMDGEFRLVYGFTPREQVRSNAFTIRLVE